MCPYTHQRELVVPGPRASYGKKECEVLIEIPPRNFNLKLEDLSGLMELNGDAVKERVDAEYGSMVGLCTELHTSVTEGIADDAGKHNRRIQTYGTNVIPMKKPKTFIHLMLMALKEPTLIILEIAAAISLALSIWNIFRPGAEAGAGSHEWIESVAIALVVVVIVLLSAINDYHKEQQFRTLQNRVHEEHKVPVIRNGKLAPVPVQKLVVGDVCLLKYGDVVPADGLVLQSHELRLDESSLTGESDPVRKDSEKDCRVLAGTHVIEGSGKIVIIAVGLNSQTGKIYKLLGTVNDKPKHKKKHAGQANGDALQPSESENASLDIPIDDPALSKKSADTARKLKNHSVFQNKLNVLTYKIGLLGFVCASATAVIIIIRFCIHNYGVLKNDWSSDDLTIILDSVIVGITILVAAIPEGLPLAVTLTLAFSAKKMMQDHNLVRHLFACETMGCATTICSDKTGTLTTNRMTVTAAWFGRDIHIIPGHLPLDEVTKELVCTAIAVNSSYSSDVIITPSAPLEQRGNKTECALLHFVQSSANMDYHSIRQANPEDSFAKVYTFNSSRKSMSTVLRIAGGYRVFCKGAAEIVLAKCSSVLDESGTTYPLTAERFDVISQKVISSMASDGLRTLCVAYRDINTSNGRQDFGDNAQTIDFENENSVVSGLTCLGIFGVEDPVRPEVPKAIRRCQGAGVTVRMVTGDNVETARSIARKCGIIRDGDESLVLEGKEFNRLITDELGNISQMKLDKIWPSLRVLARSTPKDKFTLVEGIINSKATKHREVVAVTGDGTNDAPALKKADVGFAMGIAGTDVAKEASDIILTDDNFISIVKACMWGRNIFDNVSKFLQFQLTVNVAALSVSIISACVLGDTPLKAVPMLWINMIQDTLGSLALATEPPGDALLKRKPYGRKKQIISTTIARNILGQGIYQTVVLLSLLFLGPKYFEIHEIRQIGHVAGDPSVLYTLIFNALVVMTSFNLINARCIHNEANVFTGIFRNIYFPVLWTLMMVTQVLVVEFGGYAFSTTPLSVEQWGISLFFGVGSLLWYHVLRLIPTKRRKMPFLEM
ncbi:Plasma membrane calcium-transporting ATPase 3 [Hypsibius exemplaris]|uniref:Calcium-transporting ATPase n=1 Tax=Hypsibius exemplaris TaxID=2072580 RepID=A0A1W0XAB6_HYPEX|nr:Plasma membrane calcium-transporting ATPase 3 [Hypsibius exemplaris]